MLLPHKQVAQFELSVLNVCVCVSLTVLQPACRSTPLLQSEAQLQGAGFTGSTLWKSRLSLLKHHLLQAHTHSPCVTLLFTEERVEAFSPPRRRHNKLQEEKAAEAI